VALYPTFQAAVDTALQQSLAQIPDGNDKADGIRIGQTVADRILACAATTARTPSRFLYFFGTAPGDYNQRLRIFLPCHNSRIGLA